MEEDSKHKHTDKNIEITKQIDAYLKGELSDQQVHEFWVKLLKQPKLLELLEIEAALKDIYKEQQPAPGSDEYKNRTEEEYRRWNVSSTGFISIAIAASVAILISILFILQEPEIKKGRELAINKIAVTKMESPQIQRSENQQVSPIDSLISLGLHAAFNNNLSEAERIYREIIEKYDSQPSVAMAHLNLGIINYNLRKYKKAIVNFQNALQIPDINILVTEKAYWYMGNAYLNLDNWQKARDAIYQAYVEHGVFRKPAGNLLDTIDERLHDGEKP